MAVAAGLKTFVRGNVLVLRNGVYSERMYLYLNRMAFDHGMQINYARNLLELGEMVLKKHYHWICAVHQETTEARINQIDKICDIASFNKIKVFVDAVSTFGAYHVDSMANVICTCGNKCLESIPGCSIVLYDKDLAQDTGRFCNPLDVHQYTSGIPSTHNVPAVNCLYHVLHNESETTRTRYANRVNRIRKGIELEQKFPESESINVSCFKCDKEAYIKTHIACKKENLQIYKYVDDYFLICNMGYGLGEHIQKLVEVINACVR